MSLHARTRTDAGGAPEDIPAEQNCEDWGSVHTGSPNTLYGQECGIEKANRGGKREVSRIHTVNMTEKMDRMIAPHGKVIRTGQILFKLD